MIHLQTIIILSSPGELDCSADNLGSSHPRQVCRGARPGVCPGQSDPHNDFEEDDNDDNDDDNDDDDDDDDDCRHIGCIIGDEASLIGRNTGTVWDAR